MPPAINGLELAETLRDTKGLQISAVLNGAPESLQNLIKDSTHPVVNCRTEEVADFLAGLDLVEEDLTAPETQLVENPNDAQKGDVLPGHYTVLKRLGQGASSLGLLVQKAGQDQSYVLKVANDPDHNSKIEDETERLDRSLRDRLVEFFAQTFRRQPEERFDNAEEMLRRCFEGIDEPGSLLDIDDESFLEDLLAEATFATPVADLGLGPRATNALDLANLLTVEDLLIAPPRRLARLRGVGHLTRREILAAVKILRRRLGLPSDVGVDDESVEDITAVGQLSVDLLVQRLTKTSPQEGESVQRLLGAMLGLEADLADSWPSQADLARHLNLSRARVGQLVSKFQKRWAKEPAMTQLRRDLADLLRRASGVMALDELAAALLVARGSVQDAPIRTQRAIAVLRAAVEVERSLASPRFFLRRDGDRILLAITPELLSYGRQLGDEADQLAAADPLVSPERSLAQLQVVPPPVGSLPLPDSRLLRLAAAASYRAALSSRQEFYPCSGAFRQARFWRCWSAPSATSGPGPSWPSGFRCRWWIMKDCF